MEQKFILKNLPSFLFSPTPGFGPALFSLLFLAWPASGPATLPLPSPFPARQPAPPQPNRRPVARAYLRFASPTRPSSPAVASALHRSAYGRTRPSAPSHCPIGPTRQRSLSFLSPCFFPFFLIGDGVAKHGNPPPPSMQGRRPNHRALAPLPSMSRSFDL